MKQRMIWLVVGSLVILSLVLASCAPAPTPTPTPTAPTPTAPTPTAPTPTPTKEVPVTGGFVPPQEWGVPKGVVLRDPKEPKYGGTVTFTWNTKGFLGFDQAYASPWYVEQLHLTHESLMTGDITKGPAGTGEVTWREIGWFVYDQSIPRLAESIEYVSNESVIVKVARGHYFENKPPVNGREVDAYDVAISLKRVMENPGSYFYGFKPEAKLQSAEVKDKWTVVFKWNPGYMRAQWEYLNSPVKILPREVIEQYGNYMDWRTQAGSGPFALTSYIPGTSFTFKRVQNCFINDPFHPNNKLPYIDTVKILEIPDRNTELAGVRTGKLDYMRYIPWDDAEKLMQTNPGIQSICEPERVLAIWPLIYDKVDGNPIKPFDDIRVRRALALAIDNPTIVKDYYKGKAYILSAHTSPYWTEFKPYFTPLEELPQSTRELYEYHPDKARQLLTEAGYPKGFKVTVVMEPAMVDMASVVKKYWAEIGVEMIFDVKELAVYTSVMRAMPKKYQAIITRVSAGSVYAFQQFSPLDPINYSQTHDPLIDEVLRQTADLAWWERGKAYETIVRPFYQHIYAQSYATYLPSPWMYTVWQPWLQNYRGEIGIGTSEYFNFPLYAWVDADLKEAMTGRR